MWNIYLSVTGVCLSSQRLVALFLVGPLLGLVLQHLKRGDQASAGALPQHCYEDREEYFFNSLDPVVRKVSSGLDAE